MRVAVKNMIVVTAFLLLLSCSGGGDKKQPVYVAVEDVEYGESYQSGYAGSGELVSVPFMEKGGVKYVQVEVNGVGLEMIFDTGCSTTLISLAEANYLYQKGLLGDDDILGLSQSAVADGRVVENMIVNLDRVVIGGKILCNDVLASVSSNVDAPLLLGNEVLNRVAIVTINNSAGTIDFNLR